MTFTPSHYQSAIFDFVRHGTGDGIVNACAGSGKTTSLVEAAKLVRGEAIFCAFNKHIAEAIKQKLYGTTMTARTIHSIGYECVRRAAARPVNINDSKYRKIIREYARQYPAEFKERKHAQSHLRKLINFARLTLTPVHDVEALCTMADRFNVEWDEVYAPMIRSILNIGDRLAESSGEIDYTDMLWLPYKLKLQPDQFGTVFVDEAQDLSAAQLDLVLKLRAAGGRQLYVGDPNQSIFAFAGADDQSYWKIKERTGAKELPLSICYRCPKTHVWLAQDLVPHIEARSNAPDGTITEGDDQLLVTDVAEGDLVLCRRNAPLIKHCLRLIRQRKQARVRGRDVGKELADLTRTIGEEARDFRTFPAAVDGFYDFEHTRLSQRDASESQFEALIDKCEALHNCYAGFQANTAEELAGQIESIFADDRASIWLSSIHRAKGLEENRVWILEYEKLGLPRAKQKPHEVQQEKNLRYVALTRSKDTLYLLSEAKGAQSTSTVAPQTQQSLFAATV